MKYFLIAALTTIALALSIESFSQQEVTYCRHPDGSITVVQAGMPCPYPSTEA